MTKNIQVDQLDPEQRHQLEALIGRGLESGERVTIQVWPPGVEQDADSSNPKNRARLKTRPAAIKGSLSRRDIYDGVV